MRFVSALQRQSTYGSTRRPLGFVGASSWGVALLALLVIGCNDGRSSVSGTLTLDGKPLAKTKSVQVTVMFFPESGAGVPAAAMADESGRYVLSSGAKSGLAPGKYVVTLAGTEASASGKRLVTPLRYSDPKQSDLRADVQPGGNTFDYDLSSSESKSKE